MSFSNAWFFLLLWHANRPIFLFFSCTFKVFQSLITLALYISYFCWSYISQWSTYQRWSPRGRPWPRGTSSRTHFEVLGLGLKASSPRKLPCHRLEDSIVFWTVKILLESARNLAENLRRPFFVFLKWKSPEKNFWKPFLPEKNFWRPFFKIAWKNFFKTFFFWRTLAPVSMVLGLDLERVCPWPWPRNFFVSLGSRLVSSTPPMARTVQLPLSIFHVNLAYWLLVFSGMKMVWIRLFVDCFIFWFWFFFFLYINDKTGQNFHK